MIWLWKCCFFSLSLDLIFFLLLFLFLVSATELLCGWYVLFETSIYICKHKREFYYAERTRSARIESGSLCNFGFDCFDRFGCTMNFAYIYLYRSECFLADINLLGIPPCALVARARILFWSMYLSGHTNKVCDCD